MKFKINQWCGKPFVAKPNPFFGRDTWSVFGSNNVVAVASEQGHVFFTDWEAQVLEKIANDEIQHKRIEHVF